MPPHPITRNTVFYGDNLPILREHIADESVDLVYLDPPFNSSRSYNVLFKDESGHESEAQIEVIGDTWHWNESAERTYKELVTHAPDRGYPDPDCKPGGRKWCRSSGGAYLARPMRCGEILEGDRRAGQGRGDWLLNFATEPREMRSGPPSPKFGPPSQGNCRKLVYHARRKFPRSDWRIHVRPAEQPHLRQVRWAIAHASVVLLQHMSSKCPKVAACYSGFCTVTRWSEIWHNIPTLPVGKGPTGRAVQPARKLCGLHERSAQQRAGGRAVGRTSQAARTQTVTIKVSDAEKTLLDILLRSSTKSGYSDLIRSWMYEKAVLAGLPIESVPDSPHDPFRRGKKGVPIKTT